MHAKFENVYHMPFQDTHNTNILLFIFHLFYTSLKKYCIFLKNGTELGSSTFILRSRVHTVDLHKTLTKLKKEMLPFVLDDLSSIV